MRKILICSILFLTLKIILSCNSNKKIVENNATISSIEKDKDDLSNKMLSENFKRAKLFKDLKNQSNCSHTIKVDNSNVLLDPINIEESFLESTLNEQKIWIKFQSLRMKNRCDQARPIKIIEIKKRDE